ncbi:protocadherin alpha-2-like isoform X5 [Ambystoma mexicanum]|uniref:protocadherin alpha-2-like isoform X5 n=1 Tax=Ambystoma mexicanum TaxID=8296 RepID=UPI0037E79671
MNVLAPGMCSPNRRRTPQWRTAPVLILLCLAGTAGGQVRYSVLEELGEGAQVGNVASDLGVDVGNLHSRRFRLSSDTPIQYFDINLESGIVFIKRKIDREQLCGKSASCVINLEAVMDNPLELYRVQVNVVDVNDNAPIFPVTERRISISESTAPGARFPLEGAVDPDVGTNSLRSYFLSTNDFFTIDTESAKDKEVKSVQMVLSKALDREQLSEVHLTLTAVDGGTPERSGTVQILIEVQDVNDNFPVFDKAVYRVTLVENAPVGTLVIQLNATDMDDGQNGNIYYSFTTLDSLHLKELFSINPENGEIRVRGQMDFEESNMYEIHVQAQDKGQLAMSGHCNVLVEIIDVNDNAPEIRVTSVSSPVMEDAKPGSAVALFTVTDRDSGVNGQVQCEVPASSPFQIESKFESYYSLVLKNSLDREAVSEYNLTILAKDGGFPPLSSVTSIVILVSDVNDNMPTFSESHYTATCRENNLPSSPIFQVSATDLDLQENGQVRYSLLGTIVGGISVSNLLSVHSETGNVFALQSFDYEKIQAIQFLVEAKDSGTHSLKSSTNVTLFIEDQNDNSPIILSPHLDSEKFPANLVPRSSNVGHLVCKIRAVDADSGYNAWLSYALKEPSKTTLFRIGLHTGEIRTNRPFSDSDGDEHQLIFLVMDNGKPPLSTTATLVISLADSHQESISDQRHESKADAALTNLNVYLIISIASILSIFLLVVMFCVASRILKAKRSTEECGKPEVRQNVTGNWSYSTNQQYNLYSTVESLQNDLKAEHLNAGMQVNGDNDKRGYTAVLVQNLLGMDHVMKVQREPKHPNPDWRYSASLRAGVQSSVHMEESAVLRGVPGGLEQQWPTVSSATTEPEGGEVSPPVGAGVNSNSWTFKYGPANPKQPVPVIPPDFPDNFIIPGSPAIISIRQDQPSTQAEKGNFITFGKKEETKKKKKKKKGTKTTDKKEKGNSTTDNSDQ